MMPSLPCPWGCGNPIPAVPGVTYCVRCGRPVTVLAG